MGLYAKLSFMFAFVVLVKPVLKMFSVNVTSAVLPWRGMLGLGSRICPSPSVNLSHCLKGGVGLPGRSERLCFT